MDLNKKKIKGILLIIAFSLLLYFTLLNFSAVLKGAGKILSVLSPVIIGLVFSFLLNLLLCRFEKWWDILSGRRNGKKGKAVKRGVCLLLSILIVLGVLTILIFMILPEVVSSFSQMADTLPGYLTALADKAAAFAREHGLSHYMERIPEIDFEKIGAFISERAGTIIGTTVSITASVFSVVFNIAFAVVFAVYILAQKEKLAGQLLRLIEAYFPRRAKDFTLRLSRMSYEVFSKFVLGQETEALIIGVLCYIGMRIFSMPYASAISALIAFTALIPIFGAFIGTALGALLIFVVSPVKALWFIVFIIVLQQLESNLIYPKVVGSSVGISGLWVLLSVTLGGGLFGIVGMLVAVPVFTVVYKLLSEDVRARLGQKAAACPTQPGKDEKRQP